MPRATQISRHPSHSNMSSMSSSSISIHPQINSSYDVLKEPFHGVNKSRVESGYVQRQLCCSRAQHRHEDHCYMWQQIMAANGDRMPLRTAKTLSPQKGMIRLTAFPKELSQPNRFYPSAQPQGNIRHYSYHPKINSSPRGNKLSINSRGDMDPSMIHHQQNENTTDSHQSSWVSRFQGQRKSFVPENLSFFERQLTLSEITQSAQNLVSNSTCKNVYDNKQSNNNLPRLSQLDREMTNLESAYIRDAKHF